MAGHGIQPALSAAAIGAQQAVVRLEGVWHLHSASIRNQAAAAAEPATIMIQFGTSVYDPNRTMHPLAVGNPGPNVPMVWNRSFNVKGTCLIVGEVVHAGATDHTLTVLAWKVSER